MKIYIGIKKRLSYLFSRSLLVGLLNKAFKMYLLEFRYYYSSKSLFSNDRFNILLRKKTHGLERSLFHPNRYSEESVANIVKDIEEITDRYKAEIPENLFRWSKKILKEYKTRDNFCMHCQSLKNKLPRPTSPVDVENLFCLIRQRRSRRHFLKQPLTEKEKLYISEVIQWAPSTCNSQTLEVIFIEEYELKNFVGSTIPGGKQFFSEAPCILLLISDAREYRYPEDRYNPFIDGAAAIQNVYLLCEIIDLGCCWGSYNSFIGIEKEDEVRKRLGIPSTHLFVGSLAIGRSEQFVCEIPRELPVNRMGVNYFRRRK